MAGLSGLAWREPLLASMERSPSQQLELYWSACLLGIEQAPPPLVGLLAQPPLAQLMRAEDGYALTHALFHITDFGRQPLPAAAVQAPEPLLQALFGGPLLQRLQDLLDGDSLALATDDLRIAHALQRQDLPLLLQALASAGPSATLLDAAHWLAMARELLDQARGQPAAPGPLRQPLARLQALLQLQPGGATRPTLLRVRR